jgi:hypothetical protein
MKPLSSSLGKEFDFAEKIFITAQHIDIEEYMKYVDPDIIPYIYKFQEILFKSHQLAKSNAVLGFSLKKEFPNSGYLSHAQSKLDILRNLQFNLNLSFCFLSRKRSSNASFFQFKFLGTIYLHRWN